MNDFVATIDIGKIRRLYSTEITDWRIFTVRRLFCDDSVVAVLKFPSPEAIEQFLTEDSGIIGEACRKAWGEWLNR